jgi:hypothetical protein
VEETPAHALHPPTHIHSGPGVLVGIPARLAACGRARTASGRLVSRRRENTIQGVTFRGRIIFLRPGKWSYVKVSSMPILACLHVEHASARGGEHYSKRLCHLLHSPSLSSPPTFRLTTLLLHTFSPYFATHLFSLFRLRASCDGVL